MLLVDHEKFMIRCFELAIKGLGYTKSNPLVGALLVHDGKIISEGFHRGYGLAHAESEAIDRVTDKSLLPLSTLYISLEPCCHYGKTPPCTKLIKSMNIKRVVISTLDPNPVVSGKGLVQLKEAEIDVITGILETEGRWLNRRFFTYHEKKRPYVILKWAQSEDGFMDINRSENHKGIHWISHLFNRQLVHKWRSQEMAILVGCKTVQIDDPQLTTRLWHGNNPIRILIDPKCVLSTMFQVFSDNTSVFLFHDTNVKPLVRYPDHVKLVAIDFQSPTALNEILYQLYLNGINSVIVEGGKHTIEQFIIHELWDEARVIQGDVLFKNGLKAPVLPQVATFSEQVNNDFIFYYYR